MTKCRLIFALFCLCQAVSIISIIFVYGVLLATEDYGFNELESRQFNVSVQSPLTSDDILQMTDRLSSDTRISAGIQGYSLRLTVDDYLIESFLSPEASEHLTIYYGENLSSNDFEQKKNTILINAILSNINKLSYTDESNNEPVYNVGDTFTLQDSTYLIKGIGSMYTASPDVKYIAIPFPALKSLAGLRNISITLPKVVNTATAQKYGDIIKEVWNVETVALPVEQERSTMQDNLFQMLSSLAIALLAALNFSSLYCFILKRRQFEYSIFRLYGCTKRNVFFLFLGELLFVGSAVFVLSSLVFHFGLSWIYPYMKEGIRYVLSIKDYFDIYCVYACILLLVFIPVIIKYSKHSPSEIYRTA